MMHFAATTGQQILDWRQHGELDEMLVLLLSLLPVGVLLLIVAYRARRRSERP
jgi:hypothetical protein